MSTNTSTETEHSSRKRKVFTIGDKVLIIRDLENGKSQSKLARELNIQQSTVSRMWKNRSKIISAFENDQVKSKRIRYSACKSMVVSHSNGLILPKKPGLYITGPMPVLQPKLQEISQFPVQVQQPIQARPTDSWLQRFAVKHSIIISDVSGQTLVPVATSITPNPDWLSTMWLATRKEYADQDIFHVDETGLFFKLTPENTMTCLGEHCFGGKLAGERLTVVLGTNMTGSEKRRLLVVGKYSNPQLLASIHSWPLKYESNNKAWMTSEIFESELRDWDAELQWKNRRILLLVSDCSAHPRVSNLKNIKLVYLPYHVASVRQPMGRGIFRSFKTQYRRLLLLQLIDGFRNNVRTSITLIDALRMLYKAWLRVPVEMIKNCFLQTGLMKSGSNGSVFEEFEDDIPLSLWLNNHNFTEFDSWKETIDWYVEADSELQTSEEPEEKDMKNEEAAAEESEDSLADGDGWRCETLNNEELIIKSETVHATEEIIKNGAALDTEASIKTVTLPAREATIRTEAVSATEVTVKTEAVSATEAAILTKVVSPIVPTIKTEAIADLVPTVKTEAVPATEATFKTGASSATEVTFKAEVMSAREQIIKTKAREATLRAEAVSATETTGQTEAVSAPETNQTEAVSVTEALSALRKVSKFFEQDCACSKLLDVINMETSLEKLILNTQLVKESL